MTAASLVADGLAPAAALAWGDADTVHVESTVAEEALFDVASLTKVVVTASVAAALVGEGAVRLDDRVGRFVPESAVSEATVCSLLTHTSGLPPYWHPAAGLSPEAVRAAVLAIPPEAGPGVRTVYSCLGFVTLQTFLERASGEALDALYERLIRRPLALRARFGPVDEAIPTSLSPTSTVHDPLARALGGVSGNAGLFATVGDLAKFAQAVVRQEPPVGGLLAWGDESPPFHGRGLGWQVFRPGVFGHTGFTGCRLWFAPADGRWAALLTNRVALESDPERFRAAADALRDSVLTRAHG